MQLSKKSRYGLRALIDLSVRPKTEYISLSSIAERNEIPLQFLEQVFASLRRAGIVRSLKGPQGGYKLNRDPEKVTAAEILRTLDGSYQIEREEAPESSEYREIAKAIQEELIDRINSQLDGVLESLTLAELSDAYLRGENEAHQMYYI